MITATQTTHLRPLYHGVTRMPEPCQKCGAMLWRSTNKAADHRVGWDDAFCKRCDTWVTPACPCGCLADRPTRPSDIDLPEEIVDGYQATDEFVAATKPVPGHVGVPGRALIQLHLARKALWFEVVLRIGSDAEPEQYHASSAKLRPLEPVGVNVEAWIDDPTRPVPPRCQRSLQQLILAPGPTYRLALASQPKEFCDLRFTGYELLVVFRHDAMAQYLLLRADTVVGEAAA